MKKRSKLYQATKEKMPAEAAELKAAIEIVQKHARAGFDETIELHMNLNATAGETVRGNVVLPHGSPKKKKIAVFTSDTSAAAALKDAGASIVGGDDLIAEIEASGSFDADIAIATPEMMPKVAKIAKVLGPKGLMPNPKTGTVSPDVAAVVQELVAGKVAFKMDQQGNIHESVGKVSWETEKITKNTQALIDAIMAVGSPGAKGKFVKSLTITSTMSPGVTVSL